jgi:uncharacterized membrane protein YeaQ/YmgE (transglycosylase-associated protein family)
MGRETWRFQKLDEERIKSKRLNPIWRGVGCVLVVILGFVGYVFSGWFLDQGIVYIPRFSLRIPLITTLSGSVIVQLAVSFLFMIFSYAIMSVIYAIAFPIQLGEMDVPPLKRQKTKKKR